MLNSRTRGARAAAVSRLLRKAGYAPTSPSSPRDGRLRVHSNGDRVTVSVDLEGPRDDALLMTQEIRALLMEHGGYQATPVQVSRHSDECGELEFARFYLSRPEWSAFRAPEAPMTVGELVALFQAFPQDLPVRLAVGGAGTVACGTPELSADSAAGGGEVDPYTVTLGPAS